MMTSTHTLQFLPSLSANLGILQLNNPASLNALTLEMIRSMIPTLKQWQTKGVRATLMVGTPYEKNGKAKPAFCAGGDVKKVYLAGIGKEDKSITANFFREEYQLNHMIATQAPHMPQVSIWDGVVMGGGVGLSIHGKYRVATENTIFAMPECKIGLFPDVGGTWWIPRLKLYNQFKSGVVGGVGNYLALTGVRLAAEDLIYSGIATHYVKSERLDELKSALSESTNSHSNDDSSGDCVARVLMSFHDHNIDTRSSFLSKNRNDIDFAFDGKDTMEEIFSALDSMGEDSQFRQSTLKTLKQMSPTSLKVTLEGLKRGAKLSSVGEALQMEYRMSQAFMTEDSDFYEGIRAALVDKDGKPKWSPVTLEEVTDDIVDSYFEPLGDNELDVNAIGSAKL
jgi:enoyl-CoA hydratase/carnithine racemase